MTQENKPRQAIVFPRTVLLIEIDRRCVFADCGARVRVGLTKQEAIAYSGFECEACQQWNDDRLTASDAPEWWAELPHSSSMKESGA